MIATPIGNLEDITLRALSVLKSVDVIACEDTRHTGILLSHYGISKKLIACHAHNEENSSRGILMLLDEGKDVAFCSDAGTPGVSDPGARVVDHVRKNSSHNIVPLPGASASVTLVSAAGMVGKGFFFEGFLSPKKGRRTKRLSELLSRNEPFIIYESPFRVVKTLKEIADLSPEACCVVGRELTKQFEEIFSCPVSEAVEKLEKRGAVKGEFAILVYCERREEEDADDTQDTDA